MTVALLLAGLALAAAPLAAGAPEAAAPPATAAPAAPGPADPQALLAAARAAREAGDLATFLVKTEAAAAALPDRRQLAYRLAGALALNGRLDAAADELRTVARLGVDRDVEHDPDLAALRATAAWPAIAAAFAEIRRPLARGVEAFRLRERDLLTEGVAYVPADGSFFVSSVHRGKIVRRTRDGRLADFVRRVPGGEPWGVLGLAVDPARHRLWAVSAALPQLVDRRPEEAGRTALFAFDLATGRTLARIAPPDGGEHAFNDLTVAPDGRVFVSDPGAGAVYGLAPGGERLEPLTAPGALVSPNGLALDAAARRLYVADYARGLVVLDLATHQLERLPVPDDLLPLGIDGLCFHRGALLAIQNGFAPHRVMRLPLAPDGRAVTRVEILDRAHPLFAEPTLGVVVDDALYYVARSQWESFGEDGRVVDGATLLEPLVLRLPLGD